MPVEARKNENFDLMEAPSGVFARNILFETAQNYANEPFNAVASDYDGVVSDHRNPEVAEEARAVVVERTLGQGVPLAFITGKEEVEAFRDIVEPYRKVIEEMGINLNAGEFMVYSNNGSVKIDVGLDGQVLHRNAFSAEQKEKMLESESVISLLQIYDIIEECRAKAGVSIDFEANKMRNMDSSTICFRIDPTNLLESPAQLPIVRLLKKITGKANPTRFDIAEQIKREFAEMQFEAEVSATDRSIDITPKGSTKRTALEDFSETTGVPIDDTLRIGDSPTGMDYSLLMAQGEEKRSGFTNVPIPEDQLRVIQSSEEFAGTRAPVEVHQTGNQFEKARWLIRSMPIEPKSRVSGIWHVSTMSA